MFTLILHSHGDVKDKIFSILYCSQYCCMIMMRHIIVCIMNISICNLNIWCRPDGQSQACIIIILITWEQPRQRDILIYPGHTHQPHELCIIKSHQWLYLDPVSFTIFYKSSRMVTFTFCQSYRIMTLDYFLAAEINCWLFWVITW